MPLTRSRRIAVAFALLIVLVFAGFLMRDAIPDLTALAERVDAISGWQARHPFLATAMFFVAYVVVTALSLPLAVWLTLAGGVLFGFWIGLVLVSFASTLGASLAFLAARYLLRDWVQARLGTRAESINRNLRRDGAFYLFTLRLIPVVPFFAVNLLMGLTLIRLRSFYWVSQLAMLPATAIYVNAGTQLAQLDTLSGLISPVILASFVALGIFPWCARLGVAILRRRRAFARWRRPKNYDRNLVVIGAGSAGLVASYVAAAAQARVTLVESGAMGGDCLNTGCVPSKALIRSARLAHEIRSAAALGIGAAAPEVRFVEMMERVHRTIAEIAPHDSVERYQALGVEVLQGHARIIDPWTVEVALNDGGAQRLTTRGIVIATGARPVVPQLPGIETIGYMTTDDLWQRLRGRDSAPDRLVILGGGPVGVELAQSFQRLGSAVTLIEQADRIIAKEDPEVSDHIRTRLEAEGVAVLTGHRALACGHDATGKWIEVEAANTTRRIHFDEIIVAVGRSVHLAGLGLEDLGIPAERFIETGPGLETLLPNIHVAGDAAGPYQFTHVASHQAWFAAINTMIAPFWQLRAGYHAIPMAIFCDPEVARVGLTEAEAQAGNIAHDITIYRLDDLDRAIADGAAEGFVKVLTVPGSDRILGAVIVGQHAAELITEFTLAMKHGLGMRKILATVHIYPTMAEANRFAAGTWRRARLNPRLLVLARRFHDWRRG